MTPRVEAWLRQAGDDLAMAELAGGAGFHAQSCYRSSQAAEKACKGLLIALDVEPPRTHSLDRLVDRIEATGVEAAEVRTHHLKALSRMTTATRYPDGEDAPSDLFDARDSASALATARAILAFVRRQLTAGD